MNDTHVIDCPVALSPGPVLTLSSDRTGTVAPGDKEVDAGGGLPNPTRFLGTSTKNFRTGIEEDTGYAATLHAWRIHKTAVLDAVVTISSTPFRALVKKLVTWLRTGRCAETRRSKRPAGFLLLTRVAEDRVPNWHFSCFVRGTT